MDSSATQRRHVLIGGTGRAGTTLLVQFFSVLGLDTGFTSDEAIREVDRFSNAGLERWLADENPPYIIKNPRLADELEEALAPGGVLIDAAIIPMRDLFSAAESRRAVYRASKERGEEPLGQPGTLWKTGKPHKQEAQLAIQLYRFLHTLVLHQVPIFLLDFPRFAKDGDYLVDTLEPFLTGQGISKEDARRAFRKVAKPELISEFKRPPPQATTSRSWSERFRLKPRFFSGRGPRD